jgi:hypothetical protein
VTEAPSQAISQPASEPSSFSIPEEYSDRGWSEKIKSTDDLWKGYDNAQTLIGKRPAGIPSNDASDADWDSFYKAAGRPDEAKYDFTDPEGLPEGFDSEPFKQTAAEILHAAGLNQKQAEKVYQAYLSKELEGANNQQEQSAEKEKELDARFDELTKEHFGDGYDAAEKATMDAFERYSPQSLKGSLEALQDHPEALAAVVATINGQKAELEQVRKEYGAEGSITTGNQTTGSNINETRDQLATLRASKAARDFSDPEHKQTMTQIEELQGVVNRHYNK